MAKKVSVETLRDLMKKMGVLESNTIEFEGVEIEIKQYLPIESKRVVVELVVQNAFVNDDRGLSRFDATIKESMLDFFIVREYTSLNTMNDPFEMYDALKATGLIKAIRESIPKEELTLLEKMLEDRIKEEYRLQELSVNIGFKIESTLGILNRKMSEAMDTMKNFDPSKQLEMMTSFLNTDEQQELQELQEKKGSTATVKEVEKEVSELSVNEKVDKLLERIEK